MFYYDILEFDKVRDILASYSKTIYGKELALNICAKSNIDEVNEMLDETEAANQIILRYNDLTYDNYENVYDYLMLASKNGVLEPDNFLLILNLITSYNQIKSYLENFDDINTKPLLKYLSNNLDFTKLRSSITLAISRDGKVLDQASKELFQIRRKLSQANNKIRQSLNSIMQHEANKLQDLLIVVRNNRLCLPVKAEYKNSFKGILHDVSQTNTTCYIEPESVIELQNALNELEVAEKNEIKAILTNLSLLVSANSEQLNEALDALSMLDLIFSKARYAGQTFNRPKLSTDYSFNLIDARHPLIKRDICVPISIKMTNNDSTIIITGPNTGGKTVTLKTVGLLSIMVQCGMFVDAKESSVFHVFDNIMADIGDDQSIKESLSTFSSHITKVIGILNTDLSNSLVLFDELGSGTDPKEGSALAIAIIEGLRNRCAKCITTTHYIDLKNYAYNTKGIVNASVEFNTETLKPTYRLLLGVPGESNALLIAGNLGMPLDILDMSNDYVRNNNVCDSNIKDYENKLRELNSKEEELDNLINHYKVKNDEVIKEKRNLEVMRSKYISDAKREASKIIDDSKAEANSILKELKELKNKADLKTHELAKLSHDISNLDVKAKEEQLFNEELKVNDYVFIKSYEKTGIITKVKKNRYEVNFGMFTMDFKRDDLVKTVKPKEKKEPKRQVSGYNSVSGASFKLDLRGKRYEEVKDLVEEFIDKACLSNFNEVTIVHGFGTGVVRNRVLEVLKNNPNVKSYRFGKEGEGLNGVTIVTLK